MLGRVHLRERGGPGGSLFVTPDAQRFRVRPDGVAFTSGMGG
jgi:hypothetical protein